MIRKADIILAILLIIAGLAVSYAFAAGNQTGQTVYIMVEGEEYGYYSLLEDQTVSVEQDGHINKITIKDGKVSMAFSDCRNQDCVLQGEISDTSQSIVCLPNKVVVEIRGGQQEYDAVVK